MKMRTPSLFETIKDTVVTTATNAAHTIGEKAHDAKEIIDKKMVKARVAMAKAQLKADRERRREAKAELVALKKEIAQLDQSINQRTHRKVTPQKRSIRTEDIHHQDKKSSRRSKGVQKSH